MSESITAVEPKLGPLATNILELLRKRNDEELQDPAWSVVDLSNELLRTEDKIRSTLLEELEPAGLAIEVDHDCWCVPADASADDTCPITGLPEHVMQGVVREIEGREFDDDAPPPDQPAEIVDTSPEPEPCSVCGGTGIDEDGEECDACDGSGFAWEESADLVPAGDGAVEVVEPLTAVEVVEPLTADEQAELARLEGVVAEGVKAVFVAGLALRDIRDGRLYRELHGTFEQYVEDRLGVSSSHAYRWIEAAEVQANVAGAGLRIERESHARELAQLPAGDQVEVYRRAQESAGEGRLTAKQIAEARDELMVERVVAIVEAAGEPVTARDIVAQMEGIDDPYKIGDDLREACKRHLIHRIPGEWPDQYVAGPQEFKDQKVTIPSTLVERHAKAGIKQQLDYWVCQLVTKALDAAEAGAGE